MTEGALGMLGGRGRGKGMRGRGRRGVEKGGIEEGRGEKRRNDKEGDEEGEWGKKEGSRWRRN